MESQKTPKANNCILIVDDDFINREVMKNIFASRYTFMEAENGRSGLSLIEENPERFCAVFLDVNMPNMSGIEVLRELHRQGIPEHLPIFLITSADEEGVAREAYNLGVMDVINKPVTPFVILRRVDSIVELFQARAALSKTVHDQGEQIQKNAETIDELHRNTIEALASAIEFRDVESGEHTNRIYSITKYLLASTPFGQDFSQDEIECMAIGSIMHDVGKIAISDIILNKPGRLTYEEFEIMKTHTVKGGALMEQLCKLQSHPSYLYAADIARHHHERWDGRGYPDGLVGDEITPWSQAASIADVYDALISPRVYKKAFTPDEAVEMIKNGECGVFNPKLLECFLMAEKEIRTWYQADKDPLSVADIPDGATSLHPGAARERDILDMILFSTALQSSYDMVIAVNLTKNTYYMVDYARFGTHCAESDGVFDDLITMGASSIPDSHKQAFLDHFSREKLLGAFESGKKAVRLEHPQYTDDGQLRYVATNVLFMKDPRTGDLRQFTLSRYIDAPKTETVT